MVIVFGSVGVVLLNICRPPGESKGISWGALGNSALGFALEARKVLAVEVQEVGGD